MCRVSPFHVVCAVHDQVVSPLRAHMASQPSRTSSGSSPNGVYMRPISPPPFDHAADQHVFGLVNVSTVEPQTEIMSSAFTVNKQSGSELADQSFQLLVLRPHCVGDELG